MRTWSDLSGHWGPGETSGAHTTVGFTSSRAFASA